MVQYQIGNRIKERRAQLKLSQEQLALQAGVTTTYLGQIERAERNPTVSLLEKLAKALKVNIGFFFDCESAPGISPAESRILFAVSELDEKQKQAIAQLIDVIADTMKK